jgi:hypothetical protein
MTKREAIWSLCGLALGAIAWAVVSFGFRVRADPYDGRMYIFIFAGGGLAYLAAKIMRIGKHTT